MSRSQPLIDAYGVHHRPGCRLPGFAGGGPSRAGVHVARCTGCGAVRLITRPKTTQNTQTQQRKRND